VTILTARSESGEKHRESGLPDGKISFLRKREGGSYVSKKPFAGWLQFLDTEQGGAKAEEAEWYKWTM